MKQRPLEYCCQCDEPTGRAGMGEDSIYCSGPTEEGPLCIDCYMLHVKGCEPCRREAE